MEAWIRSTCPNLAIFEEGDVLRELVVKPTAKEAANQYLWLEYMYLLQSIAGMKKLWTDIAFQDELRYTIVSSREDGVQVSRATVLSLIESDIVRRGADFGISRIVSTKAAGSIKMYFRTSAAITIPTGTIVRTGGTSASIVNFYTTTVATDVLPAMDTNTGLYYVALSVEAEVSGISGNVIAGAIKVIDNNTFGAVRCTNPNPTVGGRDNETITHFLDRLGEYIVGAQIPQRGGYIKFAEDNGCADVKVIMPGDADSTLPGTVELWVQLYKEEKLQLTKKKISDIVIEKPSVGPVVSINSISTINSETGSVLTTYIEGVDYALTKDTTSGYANSTKSKDKVSWMSGKGPTSGDTYIVDYMINSSAYELQSLLNNGSNNDVIGDVLVKVSPRVLINITIPDIVLLAGYNITDVMTKIYSRLTAYFVGGDGYGGKYMGDDVYASDLIALIDNTTGIDTFNTDNMILYKSTDPPIYNDTIDIGYYEHGYIGTVSYNISGDGGSLITWVG
jgi:hypothetical protein